MRKLPFYVTILILLCSATKPKSITWVALGDSITYLNDHQNETGNRISKGYMTMLAEKMPHISFVNKGYNGWTAMQIAEKFESLNIPKADIYTVFLGTNDWWRGNKLGTLEDYNQQTASTTVMGAFGQIIKRLKSLNPSAKIVLIGPMPRTDFVYINQYKNLAHGSYKAKNGQNLADFSQALVQIGRQEGIPVVDLFAERRFSMDNLVKYKRLKDPTTGQYKNYKFPAYIDIAFNPETDEYPYPIEAIAMTYDGLHPSDAGYKIITKKLRKIFKQIKFSAISPK